MKALLLIALFALPNLALAEYDTMFVAANAIGACPIGAINGGIANSIATKGSRLKGLGTGALVGCAGNAILWGSMAAASEATKVEKVPSQEELQDEREADGTVLEVDGE